MSEEQIPSGIPAEEWAATPASVRQLVLALMQMNEQLRERIEKLEERLNQNSQNSSKLPSSDGPNKPIRPPEAAYIQQQPAVNVDETGWRQENKRAWLWLAATPLVAIFLVMKTRGAQGVHSLLGDKFNGIVGSDRWSAYNWLDPKRRQLCWAHLIRDFRKLVERGGEWAPIGEKLLTQTKELFHLWQRVRDGTLTRTDFAAGAEPIRTKVHQLLLEGTELEHPQTRQTCHNLLKVEDALWTFVTVDDIEPTNNLAERSLRRAVLWRKRSFGTQSEAGSTFVARILTTVTTLRMQRRDVLDFLTEACAAANSQQTHPSLLPVAPTT